MCSIIVSLTKWDQSRNGPRNGPVQNSRKINMWDISNNSKLWYYFLYFNSNRFIGDSSWEHYLSLHFEIFLWSQEKNYPFFVTFSQLRKNKSECCSLRITFGLTFDVEFDFLCRPVIQIQMKICSEFCIFQLLINMSNSYQKYTGS